MNSLKTAVVVTILLGVMYGVYTTLTNQPGAQPPDNANPWPTAPGSSGAPIAKAPWPGNSADPPGERKPPWTPPPVAGGRGIESPRFLPGGQGKSPAPGPNAPELALPGPGKMNPERSVPPSPPPADTPGRNEPNKADSDDARPREHEVRAEFTAMMETARRKLDAGELAEVHLELSPLYGNPELTREEMRQLTDLLDRLAGTVIYSREHLLEPPYAVRPGETLEQIAEEYRVPWPLLAKINGIRDPNRLPPGKKIKVLRGPFEAMVHLDRYELVMHVGGRYAGRFPIGVGRDQPQLEGTYTVREKLPGRPYAGPQGELPAGDPRNPLGRLWIGLDGPIGIHGTNESSNLGHATDKGNVCLGERDIEDVYDMLAYGSRVTIRR